MALVAAAVAIPQLVGLVWWDGHSRHQAAATALSGMLERAVSAPDAREACLDDPAQWSRGAEMPGPPRRDGEDAGRQGPDVPPPDGDGPRGGPGGPQGPGGPGGPGGPAGPGGPPDDHDRHGPWGGGLKRPELHAYAAGDVADALALDAAAMPDGATTVVPSAWWSNDVAVAVRTGWGGGCEVVAVHGGTVRGFLGSVLPASPLWVAPIVLVATVMWLAVGPTVRRLRDLTAAVHDGRHPVAMAGDDEIAELSRAFDAAASALRDEVAARRAREEALREFVAHTAHDVRIPLTVLRGHLAGLEQGADPAVLRQAVAEAHYLGALLDDLSAHARMEAPEPLTRVELGPVVARVCARHAPIARRFDVALDHGVPETPVFVQADLTLVEQALSNLVYNAIRHNRAGGHVAVTLDGDDSGFLLAVLDDGPGVPPEELRHLTERGFRGSAARARDGVGEGLGLHIVARIAERHGWTFTLDNLDEGGLRAELRGR